MDTGDERESSLPQGKRVVLVHSELYIARFVSHILVRAGYQVISSDSPAEALAAAGRDPPDLVLVDVWLSGYFDIGLVRQFTALHGPAVVVLSDAPSPAQRAQAVAAGAVDYITNPVSSRDLLQQVRAALGEAGA